MRTRNCVFLFSLHLSTLILFVNRVSQTVEERAHDVRLLRCLIQTRSITIERYRVGLSLADLFELRPTWRQRTTKAYDSVDHTSTRRNSYAVASLG